MIEFQHVSKTYPNGVKGLKDVNLTIDQGEFVAIIGLSGAGKSTLIRTINRMIDVTEGTLTVDGAEVPLTRTEFNIVELLAAHPRKVYTKQELFELAWGEPYAAEDSTVSVHVSNIRAKLKPTGTDGYVQTVWGLGFKLAVDEGA